MIEINKKMDTSYKGDAIYWWNNILDKSDREELITKLYVASIEEVENDEEKEE